MKRKLLPVLCLLLVSCLMCGSITAYAADETEIKTRVSYTKYSEPEEEQTNLPLYEISIPSEMCLNEGTALPIYLITNNLGKSQQLHVSIDADRTIEKDRYLHLYGLNTNDVAKVTVGYYTSDGKTVHINDSGEWEVAVFESGNIRPIIGGTLIFDVVNDAALSKDIYTGNVYFKLSVSNS